MIIDYAENVFVAEEEGQRTILLDCNDLIRNKSRIPMLSLNGGLSIPRLIMNVRESCKQIALETDWETGAGDVASFLFNILVTKLLIQTSAPLKVVELGAVDGVLSYVLASLMGTLNNKSTLCSVCNVIGNDSNNHWLDKIIMVKHPPKLSMLVSDYDDTGLQSGGFDIVILNNMLSLGEPYSVIREAQRIVKKGGILLCYIRNAPLLESTFQLIFPDCMKYQLTQTEKILFVLCDGAFWLPYTEKEENAGEILNEIRKEIENGSCSQQLRKLIVRLDFCIDKAMLKYDLEQKVKLLDVKGKLLDYVLNLKKVDERFYKERILRECGVDKLYEKPDQQ